MIELLVQHKMEYVVLIVRIIAGILFFSQGYDKIFRIHLNRAGDASVDALRPLGIPNGLVRILLVITSILEFSGGILLIVGYMIVPALYILAACILPITIAMSWKEPLWNLQQVWTRLVILIFLLMVPVKAFILSIDYLLSVYAG